MNDKSAIVMTIMVASLSAMLSYITIKNLEEKLLPPPPTAKDVEEDRP